MNKQLIISAACGMCIASLTGNVNSAVVELYFTGAITINTTGFTDIESGINTLVNPNLIGRLSYEQNQSADQTSASIANYWNAAYLEIHIQGTNEYAWNLSEGRASVTNDVWASSYYLDRFQINNVTGIVTGPSDGSLGVTSITFAMDNTYLFQTSDPALPLEDFSLPSSEELLGFSNVPPGLGFGNVQILFGNQTQLNATLIDVSGVPLPAGVWLFCSGLLGMLGIARRNAPQVLT